MSNSPQRTIVGGAGLLGSVLLVLSACVVAFAFATRDRFVDDAFIGFQYIQNMLDGNGFVFHPDQPHVEGVTNIGWLLALTPFCAIAAPMTVAKLAGLALVLATLILTACLGRGLAANPSEHEESFNLVFPPLLLLATSYDFLYFSLAGMETALLAALLTAMACIALRRPRSMALPALGAVAFGVHPEAVAVYPLYVAMVWLGSRYFGKGRCDTCNSDATFWRGYGIGLCVFAALIGIATAARFAYFGDFLPNTFYSKPGNAGLAIENAYQFLMGQNSNVAFPVVGWLSIPVLALGYIHLRRASPTGADMLAAICTIGLAFAVYSRPDWTALPRYFAPYLPAAILLIWAGTLEGIQLASGLNHRPKTSQAITAAVFLALVLTNLFDSQSKSARTEEYPGYVLAGKNLIGPAEWMRDHLPPEATIATRRIGALAYFSRRNVFDYTYGLTDRRVARLVAQNGDRFNSPTAPALAELWRERQPDYLLEDGRILDSIIQQAKGSRERFVVHGIDYRVIEEFPIGLDVSWTLAERIPNDP